VRTQSTGDGAVSREEDRLVVEMVCALDGEIGRVEVTGLDADTRYEVAIVVGGVTLTHRVRTAPADDDPRPVRIAVSADCDPNPEFASGMLDAIVDAEPELMISLGDFPYTDNGPPAQTVADYRARHVELRGHPPVRTLLEACGLRAIYDDHEFRNDWDARFVASEPARYAAAMQVWDEFFPLRAPDGDIRYRSWRWGAHVECFLLDCRRFRSANSAPDDERKTMLGAAQHRWLIDSVTRSTATFKLVLTSVALDYGAGTDHWIGFRTERDGMLAALVGVPGLMFVSADQHWFASHRHAFGIRELQVGPLARGLGTPPSLAPASVVFRAVRYNAGIIDIDGDQLTFSALGDDGEVFYTETLSAAELTPRA
ncbi:MAG TPA: alkaline phosphatase D family protein, partial [Kofleriaceae bacterium]|nr:alkaline phosphatase D family protein [Kofleriaceae bacterium]